MVDTGNEFDQPASAGGPFDDHQYLALFTRTGFGHRSWGAIAEGDSFVLRGGTCTHGRRSVRCHYQIADHRQVDLSREPWRAFSLDLLDVDENRVIG